MRAEFFRVPELGKPAVQDPERVIPGHQDLTRQMVGEPALRLIYGKNGNFFPCCPDCGIEVGPGEEFDEVVIGDQLAERVILCGLTATYRVHKSCECPERGELLKRICVAILNR